jgi:hypothetical protein
MAEAFSMSLSAVQDDRHSAGFRSDPWPLKIAWIVLVVLSAFLVLAPLLDIVSDPLS